MKAYRKLIVNAVRDCAEKGMGITEAAKRLEMSYPTIRKIANENGISFERKKRGPRDQRSAMVRQIAKEWRGKATAAEIAAAIGVTPSTIINHWYRVRQLEADE